MWHCSLGVHLLAVDSLAHPARCGSQQHCQRHHAQSNFDEGFTFWLLVDTLTYLLWPTVLGVSLVALGYVTTAVQVLLRHSDHKEIDSVVLTLASVWRKLWQTLRLTHDAAGSRLLSPNWRCLSRKSRVRSGNSWYVRLMVSYEEGKAKVLLYYECRTWA